MNHFVQLLDLFGVAAFAASGALKASSKRMDVFGFVLIATATGIGGGTLRDLLLGVRPVFWIDKPEYLAVCVATAVLGFFVAHRLHSRQSWLLWADAVGLATFSVLGAEVALVAGAPASVAVLMGLITATFGGILRDVLCAESPLILHREIYATAAAAGSLVYVVADAVSVPDVAAMLVSFAVAFGARAAGILFGLSLPTYGGTR